MHLQHSLSTAFGFQNKFAGGVIRASCVGRIHMPVAHQLGLPLVCIKG